jgi:hypothetical protein
MKKTKIVVVILHKIKVLRDIDERVIGIGMGLFLIGDHWPKILPQNSKGAS